MENYRFNKKRGMALFLTLGFTTILVMMLGATLTSTSGGNIFAQDYHRKTAALYAAESGLAMIQDRLETNPDWEGTFDHEPTPFGEGSYSVSFGPSVNNLEPPDPTLYKSGPYGPVAPGTAYLKVEGHAFGRTEVVECIVGRKSENFLHAAMVATGKIYLDERVDVAGRVSSNDLSLTPADVISNFQGEAPWGNSTPPVYWDESVTSTDQVRGTIRSASESSGSISSNLVSISDEALVDQAPVPVANVQIQDAIDAKSGVAVRVPTSPTSPLSGDHYEGSHTTVTGDLILNNASLYIDGDLTVLGSIRGVGAVYVSGDTTFSGDSVVIANEDGVVLYSQGNVHLKGFNGTEWMDAVTASQGRSLEWSQTKQSFQRLKQIVTEFANNPQFTTAANPALAPPPDTPPIGSPDPDDGPAIGFYWRSEAGLLISNLAKDVSIYRPPGITENDLLGKMASVIDNEPSNPTQRFMAEKFRVLKDPSADTDNLLLNVIGINDGDTLTGSAEIVQNFAEGDQEGYVPNRGLQLEIFLATARIDGDHMGEPNFDAYEGLTDAQLARALVKHAHWLDLYNFDALGTSYFQGNIYTRGAIYAAQEVTIIGSLSAVDDPDEPDVAWTPPDRDPDDSDISLKPGDIHLGQGTRILHLSNLNPGPVSTVPSVGVVTWLR